jgi:nanoRNase/pAp phosphatase (c-di-AMP/oligoRNAs hydrolase)
MNNATKTTVFIVVATLLLMTLVRGCGCFSAGKTKKNLKADKKKIVEIIANEAIKNEAKLVENKKDLNSIENSLNNFNFNHRETQQLYNRLEYAFSLYTRHNYEMAINEVEGLINRIDNDPYLESQAWAMAAMIYEKQGKLSRRKRANRKMVGAIEALQKDKRYTNVYKEGMENQELFDAIVKAGGQKYADAD